MASNNLDEGVDCVDAVISKTPVLQSPCNSNKPALTNSRAKDEGFDSPSVSSNESPSNQNINKNADELKGRTNSHQTTPVPSTSKIATKITDNSSSNLKQNNESNSKNTSKSSVNTNENKLINKAAIQQKQKAESLAIFIILTMLGKNNKPKDKIEETLLMCVKSMMSKHETRIKGIMNRLNITEEFSHDAFEAVVDDLFEGDKNIINWGRIIAFYCFAGQLACYCKEKKMDHFAIEFSSFIGKCASRRIGDFVVEQGGWVC